jgi:hypothetical protein
MAETPVLELGEGIMLGTTDGYVVLVTSSAAGKMHTYLTPVQALLLAGSIREAADRLVTDN